LVVNGYRAAETVVSVLPRKVDDMLATCVADTLVTLRPGRFRGLKQNLAQVVPEASASELKTLVRRNARNWARSWVDVLEMRKGSRRIEHRIITAHDVYHFERARDEGKGVVLVSLHYGSWEAGLAAWNTIGSDLALLAERIEPEALFQHILGSRGALGVKVIALDVPDIRASSTSSQARAHGASAMREVMKHLRSGGCIAIALDRDLVGTGVPMEFFGRPAAIPVGAVEIGIRAGAAIVPVVLERIDRHKMAGVVYPRIEYDADAPRGEEARRVSAEILRICEEAIRLHPEQWHVFDPIWGQKPA
jgi:phosphatidylinositol dimannoside acyltransferase